MHKYRSMALLLLALCLTGCHPAPEDPPAEEETRESVKTRTEEETTEKPEAQPEDPEAADIVEDPAGGPVTVDGIPLVNKKYGLSRDYAPGEDPQAVLALQELLAAMQAAGLDVSNSYSGFRSWDYQQQLYDSYVAAHGQQEADTFSARPGYSEHQTGLAFDLMHSDGQLLTRQAEAQWLLDHAQKYGFIVRYQAGWEEVTGYMAEPWHLRYIGDRAGEIREAGVPLETYLHAQGGDYESGT